MSRESREFWSASTSIEAKIQAIVWEIEKEYRIWKNTLEKLMAFKLEKGKENISQETGEYKNALISEIKKEANSGEISSQNNETISEEQYQILAEKLIEISKLREYTQSGIEALRIELTRDIFNDNIFSSNSLITKSWYSAEILERLNHPKNFSDELMWFWVWCVETWVVCWKLLKDALIWIGKAPIDIINIFRGKAQLKTSIKI